MAQRATGKVNMMYANNLAIQDFLTKRQKDIRASHKQKASIHKSSEKLSSRSPIGKCHSNIYIETTDTDQAFVATVTGPQSRRLSATGEKSREEVADLARRLYDLERKFDFQESALKEAVKVMRSVQQSHIRQIQENEVLQSLLMQIRENSQPSVPKPDSSALVPRIIRD